MPSHRDTSYHLIGVGGIGMSSLARILLEKMETVSGSDQVESSITQDLLKRGAQISIGHSGERDLTGKTVVVSTDIKQDNPEFQAALRQNCEIIHRSDLLQRIMEERQTLAVAGSHGKTTTTALLTWVLNEGGKNPGFSIGGIAKNFDSNGKKGTGSLFVAEADESDGTFTKYRPYGAIVTNIGLDHMNHFINEQNLSGAFKLFIDNVQSKDHLFWCGDDTRLKEMRLPGSSYGFGNHCALRASDFMQQGWRSFFNVAFKGRTYSKLEIALTGRHNVLNALAVFGMALTLNIPEETIRNAFKSFLGVARRCEFKGEKGGVLFFDDYAHHPTEIATTLKAIKEAAPERRQIVLFQPHRYSRTKDCMGNYGSIFDTAHEVVVTDIYAAGEDPIPGVTAEKILAEIKHSSKAHVRYLPYMELKKWVPYLLKKGDLVVTLGAGSITKSGPEVMSSMHD